jgi:hypothetical protein
LRVRSGWRHKAPRVRIRRSRDIYRRVGMLRRAGALTSGSVASNAVKIGCDTHALVHRHVRAAGAAGSGPGAATASCIRSKHTAHSRARGTEAAAARMGGEHRMHARLLMVYRLLFPDGGNERAACAGRRPRAPSAVSFACSGGTHTATACAGAHHSTPVAAALPLDRTDCAVNNLGGMDTGARHRLQLLAALATLLRCTLACGMPSILRVRRRIGRGSRMRHCGIRAWSQ